MKYEYKDLFVKTCDEIDGKGSCKKSHMATKCINDKCVEINQIGSGFDKIDKELKKRRRELLKEQFKIARTERNKIKTQNKTLEDKQHKKEYYQRPDVKQHKKEYNQRPEVKQHTKEYNQRPEVKQRVKEYNQRLEVKQYKEEYNQRPEVQQHTKEYNQRPEIKQSKKEYGKEYYNKISAAKSLLLLSQTGSGKNFKCKKCDYKTKDPVHLIKHTKKYHFNVLQKGSGCHHCSNEIKGGSPDPKLQKILRYNLSKVYSKGKLNKSMIKTKEIKEEKKEIPMMTLNFPFMKKSSQKGSGKKQFYGKSSKVMVKVPENVRKTALYAFKLKKLGFEGGRETGWKRAKQLSTKEYIPIEDLRYMRAWFARHIYSSYPTFLEWKKAGRQKDKKWHKVHGIVSWIIWGGDAAFKWVNSEKNLNLLNKYFNKEYKSLKKRN